MRSALDSNRLETDRGSVTYPSVSSQISNDMSASVRRSLQTGPNFPERDLTGHSLPIFEVG
jgi:hypothetical protein